MSTRPTRAHRRAALGVSLIEALVALAVMAIGLLGVVGMQATLRANADVSRQRSEAVRLAQQAMEDLRAFNITTGAANPAEHEYTDIATQPAVALTLPPNNATYTLVVTSPTPPADAPRVRTTGVRVSWFDRTANTSDPSQAQSVELVSAIGQASPELATSLVVRNQSTVLSRPLGRHPSIPRSAIPDPIDPAQSRYTVPGSGGVVWIFSNSDGLITQIDGRAGAWAMLSGTVRYATSARLDGNLASASRQPTEADAERPLGPVDTAAQRLAQLLQVQVTLAVSDTVPDGVRPPSTPVSCYTVSGGSPMETQYHCAVPMWPDTDSAQALLIWSGRVGFVAGSDADVRLASSPDSHESSEFKVCRYTPEDTDTPTAGNRDNPLDFFRVGQSLQRKDFLVIRAGSADGLGDRGRSFTCPRDLNPLPLNANTRAHQPR